MFNRTNRGVWEKELHDTLTRKLDAIESETDAEDYALGALSVAFDMVAALSQADKSGLASRETAALVNAFGGRFNRPVKMSSTAE